MMRQWSDIKRAYPDCIVLFRLGDFYEAFNEDAGRVAEICDVVLTSRPVKKGERVPMAGVPYHSVDGYIAQMVRTGAKVAIVEQTGADSNPEKRARMSRAATRTTAAADRSEAPTPEKTSRSRRIMEREVVRVVTPGTLVEGDLIDSRSHNYLAALAESGGRFGLAHADITTGVFGTMESTGPAAREQIIDELVRLRPAELLVPQRDTDEDDVLGDSLREALSRHRLQTVVLGYQSWRFDPETAGREVLELYGSASLDAYGCADKPLAVGAAGAIIAYLRETQQGARPNLSELATYVPGDFMTLDAATRRNLELVESVRGERKGSLLWVIDETVSAMGARRLRDWLERPLVSLDLLETRLDSVGALVEAGEVRSELRATLSELPDLERLTSRVIAGYAGPRELKALAKAIRVLPAASEILARDESLPANLRLEVTPGVFEAAELIEAAIADEPPATLGVPGVIRKGHSEELDAISSSVAEAKEWIVGLEAHERERTGIKQLKVGFNKVFGYYLGVPKSRSGDVPEEYQRKQTLVDSERYITPELKERESEVLHAEERIVALERELFLEVMESLATAADEVVATARAVGRVDALASLAEVAARYGYSRPELDSGRDLAVEAGRHPVVERMPLDVPFVPNDVAIGKGEVVILTGPNMAGKSTVGRQLALIVLMAQMGSFVPAERAKLGLVDRIFTRVGAQDELAAGRSTFMVEMVETANILNHATDKSLIVLDELGRGTSTYDGMAIAWAVIEHIHNHPRLGSRTLFATHYHELTALAELLPRVKNYNMAVTEHDDHVVFLHRVEPGSADRSYGVHVAELAGLSRDVVQRAWQVLERLEAEGNMPLQGARGRPAREAGQLPLFAPLSEEHPVLRNLKALDLDTMTPIEALARLYELQRELAEPEAGGR